VLPAVRLYTISRLLAVFVAIGISGADDLATSLAPEPPHRCSCATRRGTDHHCHCPVCARLARRAAAQASTAAVPPCHRELVAREQAEEERREEERLAREGRAAGLREDCGQDGPGLALHHHETFLVPSTAGLTPPGQPERAGAPQRLDSAFRPAPEPPRPRA